MHEQARIHSIALKKVEDELQALLPRVTDEVTSDGPRVLTPDLNRFVVLSAERARLQAHRAQATGPSTDQPRSGPGKSGAVSDPGSARGRDTEAAGVDPSAHSCRCRECRHRVVWTRATASN